METIETTLKNYDELVQKIKDYMPCSKKDKNNFRNFDIAISSDHKILDIGYWWQHSGCDGDWESYEIPIAELIEKKIGVKNHD